ncbi:PQQ-dependent sugar dehydrogenase [Modestobacter sp. VKM Ac-2984]|uniref:PQQ-dependent sugar dehydrogenase n=1 Tax=Modestobacter sp. VKM Ac-2984 TaxID=3004138 RepID=UPI0022A9FC09|nr:PQQ-dependent sugar dehydrogenase [Modestobacter sp. VKM Ac-2984]MCZ2816632.1 PQQ-dependent sugar dehydrogenase [Modestobacter sp. VKM Ac-2984]
MGRRTAAPGARRRTALFLGGLLLAGCGGGYEPAGPFRDVPQGQLPQVAPPPTSPAIPAPGQPSTPGADDDQAGDPNVVATDLAVPTGLVLLPDGTAVVGERDTGRLLQVFPDGAEPRELMTVPGVDTGGDGGLLGLALSPTFLEDGLFYAYVSTATDNRVVRFPIGGTPNPVLTGIPRGEVHNGGGLLFGPDGVLYVGTGDVGDPALAADPASPAGKVLAIDVFGQPAGAGPLVTRGHRDVTALCQGGDQQLYATDDALQGPDEFNALVGGGDFGPGGIPPVLEVPGEEGGLGGCAVTGPYVFLGALDGQQVHVAELDGGRVPVEEPTAFLDEDYGRLRSVAVDAEGALWITTSNRDGVGTPTEDDDKVLRVLPPTSSAGSPL